MLDFIGKFFTVVGIIVILLVPTILLYFGAAWVLWDINLFDNIAALTVGQRGQWLLAMIPQVIWALMIGHAIS